MFAENHWRAYYSGSVQRDHFVSMTRFAKPGR